MRSALARADATLPPPPGPRLRAADLDRALRRSNGRRAATALAVLVAVGLGWLQARAAATATGTGAAADRVGDASIAALTVELAESTVALRARWRAAFAIGAATIALDRVDAAAAARQRDLPHSFAPNAASHQGSHR